VKISFLAKQSLVCDSWHMPVPPMSTEFEAFSLPHLIKRDRRLRTIIAMKKSSEEDKGAGAAKISGRVR
jgi:hypothetical protein